jgi:hypothetical protein
MIPLTLLAAAFLWMGSRQLVWGVAEAALCISIGALALSAMLAPRVVARLPDALLDRAAPPMRGRQK